MSSIGKIFTVLNLILAAAFLGWAVNAVSVGNEYKAKLEKEQSDRANVEKTLNGEVAKLKDEAKELRAAREAAVVERDRKAEEAKRNKDDLVKLQNDFNDLRTSVTGIQTTLGSIEEARNRLQSEKDRAEKAQRDAEAAREAALAAQKAAQDAANDSEGKLAKANEQIASLEKERKALQDERTTLETNLATLVANTGVRASDFTAMPDIQGAVVDVALSPEPGLVAINKGADDQVKRGYTFEIYEGKTYKGQARVDVVHKNMCSATLVRKVPGQTVRQGDGASTRL